MIVEVTVKTRPDDHDIPLVASFPGTKQVLQAFYQINQTQLPLWHVSFANGVFTNKQKQAEIAAAKIKPHWGEIGHGTDTIEAGCCWLPGSLCLSSS